MKLMAQNNFLNKSNSTLLQLTSVDPPQKSSTFAVIEDSALSLLFSPFLIYGTIILFFAIFLGGLLYQIKSQTFEMKRMISTLVVAILVGSIPFTLKTALQVTSISSRAGPDEDFRSTRLFSCLGRSSFFSFVFSSSSEMNISGIN